MGVLSPIGHATPHKTVPQSRLFSSLCRLTSLVRLRRAENDPTTQQRQSVLSQCGLCKTDAHLGEQVTSFLKGPLRVGRNLIAVR